MTESTLRRDPTWVSLSGLSESLPYQTPGRVGGGAKKKKASLPTCSRDVKDAGGQVWRVGAPDAQT